MSDEQTRHENNENSSAKAREKTARRLSVVVVTGDHPVYEGEADRVVAPALYGQVSILPHHAAYLAALEPGELIVRDGDHEEPIAIGGGFIEVRDDTVIVLADSAERAREIDVQRAREARRRAEALVRRYRNQPESQAAVQALRRSRARIKVAQRLSRR